MNLRALAAASAALMIVVACSDSKPSASKSTAVDQSPPVSATPSTTTPAATTTFVARRPRTGIDTSIAAPLTGMLETTNGQQVLRLHIDATEGTRPIYFALEVEEIPLVAPVTPDIKGIVVERWYERFEDGTPIVRAKEGDLVRVRLKITVPADRAFVALGDEYFAYGAIAGLLSALIAGFVCVLLGYRSAMIYAPRITTTFFIGLLLYSLVHSDSAASNTPTGPPNSAEVLLRAALAGSRCARPSSSASISRRTCE